MPSIPITLTDLFDKKRCPYGWNYVPFIVYFPFGTLLAIIRIFIGIQMLIVASVFRDLVSVRKFILKMMCNILGLIIREDRVEAKDKYATVFVANHITPLDCLAFHASSGSVSPKSKLIPSVLSWLVGYEDMGLEQGFDRFSEHMRNHLHSSVPVPVLLQPEGSTTNGKRGLLRFQHKLLNEVKKVQPVAVRTWRPPIGLVSTCVLGSKLWVELFWFFFVPCTVFFLSYLPTVTRNMKEDTESFTKRIEEMIAKHLGIECTKFTAADKVDEEKKLMRSPPPSRPPNVVNSELQRMITQVTEVLPYVPSDVVLKDLVRTRSVDITISNILEGHITFVPLPSTTSVAPAATKLQKNSKPINSIVNSTKIGESSSLDTSAPTFPKSAQERNLSFLERKNRLIENARRRYIEKHGLKLAGLST
jgi:ancient ubiquitous protein 1